MSPYAQHNLFFQFLSTIAPVMNKRKLNNNNDGYGRGADDDDDDDDGQRQPKKAKLVPDAALDLSSPTKEKEPIFSTLYDFYRLDDTSQKLNLTIAQMMEEKCFLIREKATGILRFAKKEDPLEFRIGELLRFHNVPHIITARERRTVESKDFLIFDLVQPHVTLYACNNMCQAASSQFVLFDQQGTAAIILRALKQFCEFWVAVYPQEALSAVHPIQLWHRDLHLKQLMFVPVDEKIDLKVFDFGNARISTKDTTLDTNTKNSGGDERAVKEIFRCFRRFCLRIKDQELYKLVQSLKGNPRECLEQINKYEQAHNLIGPVSEK